jgi:TPR repeat protein
VRESLHHNNQYIHHLQNTLINNVVFTLAIKVLFLRLNMFLLRKGGVRKTLSAVVGVIIFSCRKASNYWACQSQANLKNAIVLFFFCLSSITWAGEAEELDKAYGYATTGNYDDAIAIWEKLAKSGEPNSLYNLSIVYERGVFVDKDVEKSFDLCQQAAIKGQIPAQAHMGTKYLLGIGVEKNLDKAIEWYQQAAEKGDMAALASLGNIYVSEEGGNDYVKAHDYWSTAASLGDVNSVFNLAILFHRGAGEYKVDIKRAIDLYTAAATAGSLEAMANLVGIYSIGDGVPVDLREAYFWCDISVAAGFEENRPYLKYLKSQLSAEELKRAKSEILNWQELRRSYVDYGNK